METHFQDESARLELSAVKKLLRRTSDVQNLLRKNSALFCSHVTKA